MSPRSARPAPRAAKKTARARRAPDPADRQRDAERTRQRILDAARSEFADKGYAGARVRAIADRAGVNSQLISYYFGGKQALYGELIRRWHEHEATIEAQDLSLPELVVAYLDAVFEQPEMTRMFTWEGLSPAIPDELYPRPGGEAPEVADLRRRQEAGEIADDIDPAYLLIAMMGAVNTPVTMPQMIERICGLPADSDAFRQTFAEQLRIMLRHLARPDGEDAPRTPPPTRSRRGIGGRDPRSRSEKPVVE
ncbi:MAG TPA: TetR family transcriptional regulator [Acidimicrobiales bacterium]